MPAATPGSPRVSIVVPAYNRAEYLGRTLDSVLAQTMPDWELVVSDDGSTDETAAIADRYAASDARIRVVRSANGGVARARNRGWQAIGDRSEFLTFLDSDDRWLPDALEVLTGHLDAHADLVSVYGLARCIDGDDQLIPGDDLQQSMHARFEYRGRQLVALSSDEPTTFAGMVFENYPFTPGLHLVRRDVMERVGPFDPDTDPGDDWDMAIRISRQGPIGFLEHLVLEWRRHPETLTGTSPRWRKAYYRVRAKTLAAPENTPQQRALARTAYLAASRTALGQAWAEVRRGHAVPAGKGAARAADIAWQYTTTAVPLWARRVRSTRPRQAEP